MVDASRIGVRRWSQFAFECVPLPQNIKLVCFNISSECDVNFVHCRIVYSLESRLVDKIDSGRPAHATCDMFICCLNVRTNAECRRGACVCFSLKTELSRLKQCSRAFLAPISTQG